MINVKGSQEVRLHDLRFSAKVDYVTLASDSGKVSLPMLNGKPKWARSKNWKFFSIHDPSPADVVILGKALADPKIAEIEISIDVRCAPAIADADREATLRSVMVNLFGRKLDPRNGPFMTSRFRGCYRHNKDTGGRMLPYNLRLPDSDGQQLHGLRDDHAQVKCYLKMKDQGRDLAPADAVARVEVRLSGAALTHHGIERLNDLLTFRFRRQLTPYFRFVDGVELQGKDADCEASRQRAEREWRRVGVGSVSGRGKLARLCHRLRRDTSINDRIGQALHRLEVGYRRANFVREQIVADSEG